MAHNPGTMTPFGLSEIAEDEVYPWLPLSGDQLSHTLHIQPLHDRGTIELTAATGPTAAQQAAIATKKALKKVFTPGRHPAEWPVQSDELRRKNIIIFACFATFVVLGAVLGPVMYVREMWAAAERAAAAERNRVIPPLPPMVPVTKVFYDGFSYLDSKTWTHTIGNGMERGTGFWGFGNAELQCYTSDPDNVAILAPDPSTQLLQIQAVYHPTAVQCTDRRPFNSTQTHWTSGRIVSKSKRILQAPDRRLPGTNGTGSCTSLFVEGRIKFSAVKGNRAALLLLPEPQNQTSNSTRPGDRRCGWVDECGKYGRWPASGEIDIVSHIDARPTVSHAVQLREYGDHRWRVGVTSLGETAAGWHTYRLEWNCEFLRWFVDGVETLQVSRTGLKSWPFDQPFFIAVEYSIGGRLVDSAVEPVNSFMLVDYIRAWPGNEQPPTNNTVVLDVPETASSGPETSQAAEDSAHNTQSNMTDTANGTSPAPNVSSSLVSTTKHSSNSSYNSSGSNTTGSGADRRFADSSNGSSINEVGKSDGFSSSSSSSSSSSTEEGSDRSKPYTGSSNADNSSKDSSSNSSSAYNNSSSSSDNTSSKGSSTGTSNNGNDNSSSSSGSSSSSDSSSSGTDNSSSGTNSSRDAAPAASPTGSSSGSTSDGTTPSPTG